MSSGPERAATYREVFAVAEFRALVGAHLLGSRPSMRFMLGIVDKPKDEPEPDPGNGATHD